MCTWGLLQAAVHLEKHTTCHLDIKDDNVLVSASGHLAMCDFGTAVRFVSREMRMPYMQVRLPPPPHPSSCIHNLAGGSLRSTLTWPAQRRTLW